MKRVPVVPWSIAATYLANPSPPPAPDHTLRVWGAPPGAPRNVPNPWLETAPRPPQRARPPRSPRGRGARRASGPDTGLRRRTRQVLLDTSRGRLLRFRPLVGNTDHRSNGSRSSIEEGIDGRRALPGTRRAGGSVRTRAAHRSPLGSRACRPRQERTRMTIFKSELIGTALLVLLGDGVVAGVLLAKSKAQNAGWVVITFGWGIAVMVGAYSVVNYS